MATCLRRGVRERSRAESVGVVSTTDAIRPSTGGMEGQLTPFNASAPVLYRDADASSWRPFLLLVSATTTTLVALGAVDAGHALHRLWTRRITRLIRHLQASRGPVYSNTLASRAARRWRRATAQILRILKILRRFDGLQLFLNQPELRSLLAGHNPITSPPRKQRRGPRASRPIPGFPVPLAA